MMSSQAMSICGTPVLQHSGCAGRPRCPSHSNRYNPSARRLVITARVTSNRLTFPQAGAVAANELTKERECFGVFCLEYDISQDDLPKAWAKPIKVAVTGAAGRISNHLLFQIASGSAFGPHQPVHLQLLGSERSLEALEGVAMELEDSLYPLLREVKIGIEAEEIFENADWALLIGAKPREKGMERRDLLDINGKIFVDQGRALNESADKNCKVIVVGNPCNTNALIAMKHAPKLDPRNFHALTRLDENRAKCQLALKAGVFYDKIQRMTIWGNHSTTQVPDYVNALINGKAAVDTIEESWLKTSFTPVVQSRGGALIKKAGRSSAASTAVSIVDEIRSLTTPTAEGDWFSSGVLSDGNPYGVPEGLVFSMPCRSNGDGSWEFVDNIIVNDWLEEKIAKSAEELTNEKGCVSHLLGESGGHCKIVEDTMLAGEN